MVLTYCSQVTHEVAECFDCCFARVVFKSFWSSNFMTRRYTVPQELSMSSKSLPPHTWRLLKHHPTIRYTVQSVSPVQHHEKLLFGGFTAKWPSRNTCKFSAWRRRATSVLASFKHSIRYQPALCMLCIPCVIPLAIDISSSLLLLIHSNTVSSGFLKESFRKWFVTKGWTGTLSQDGSGEKTTKCCSL